MQNLKTIRKAAGLTQIQLSQKAHVPRFRIYLAEAGSIQLRPEEVAAINAVVMPAIERTARLVGELQKTAVSA